MGSSRRLIGVPSETYVYAEVDPKDVQTSATNIMTKLAGFRSFTYLHPYEDVDPKDAPPEVREKFESGNMTRDFPEMEAPADEEDEEPIILHFQDGAEPGAGMSLCRLRSATYVAVETDPEDVEGTWKAVKGLLGTPRAVSSAVPDVDVIPLSAAPEDVRVWVTYAAADRVVMPLWPEDQIENPERVTAWREAPYRIEERQPYSGAYFRVVAVYPEPVRGMLCRMWHQRRDDSPGIGTVRGKYPVDVAVSVPTEKRTPHVHSFSSVETRDWRPGLLLYSKTGEDGCPLSYVGERLEAYCYPKGWVPEGTWRAWLEGDGE